MIVLAHAGHWAVQLIYLFPLAVLVGVILVGRARDRREQAEEGPVIPDEGTKRSVPPPGGEGIEQQVERPRRLDEDS